MKDTIGSFAPKLITAAVLLLCLAITAYGFANSGFLASLPWDSRSSLVFFLVILGLIFSFLFLFWRFWRVPAPLLWIYCVGTICLLTGQAWPLLTLALFVASSYTVGEAVLGFLGISSELRNALTNFLMGAGCYGLLVGLLAHFPVNYPGLYGVLVVAPLLVTKGRVIRGAWRYFSALAHGPWRTVESTAVLSLLSAFGVIHLLFALMPELGADALQLHLFVPTHLFERQEWGFDQSLYSMALIPMLGDWMFSIGYMLSGEIGARLVNLFFTYVMAYQGYAMTRYLGVDSRLSLLTPLLFLCSPLVVEETSSLHVEAVWGSFIVGGVMLLLQEPHAEVRHRNGVLQTAALMFAFSANAKAVTLPMLPVLFAYVLYRYCIFVRQGKLQGFVLPVTLFLVVASVPYITAFWVSGNPVFPFFNAIFKSHDFPLVNFHNWLYSSGLTWDVLYAITFHSSRYLEATTGAPGFQWLLLLPASILSIVWSKEGKSLGLLVVSIASVYMVFRSQSYLRYILPSFLFLTALIVVAVDRNRVTGWLSSLTELSVVLAIILNVIFFTSATGTYRRFPLEVLFDDAAKVQYLASREQLRLATELVKRANLERSPVAFFVHKSFSVGLNSDALHPNWYNSKYFDKVKALRDPSSLIQLLGSYGASYVIQDEAWGARDLRESIEASTDLIARFGTICVRRLKDQYRFSHELLSNVGFDTNESWAISPGASIAEGLAVVTVASPITQAARVIAGRLYRNEVIARCADGPAQGRVQVNWYDAQMNFVDSSGSVFDCTDAWQSYQMEVLAPRGARISVVYGGAHTDRPIQLKKVSLRGAPGKPG